MKKHIRRNSLLPPASSEKMITKFALGLYGNGEIGVVDEANKTISLIANYSTNLPKVRLILASPYGSTIYLNNATYSDRKDYNLTSTGVTKIKVVAQDGTEVEYAIKVVLDKPVNTFTFKGLIPAPRE